MLPAQKNPVAICRLLFSNFAGHFGIALKGMLWTPAFWTARTVPASTTIGSAAGDLGQLVLHCALSCSCSVTGACANSKQVSTGPAITIGISRSSDCRTMGNAPHHARQLGNHMMNFPLCGEQLSPVYCTSETLPSLKVTFMSL